MNNFTKSSLCISIAVLYAVYFYLIAGQVPLSDIREFTALDHLFVFRMTLPAVPLYMLIFALQWKELRYFDFSFVYGQIVLAAMLFIFSGSWTNAVYVTPSLAVLFSGLYLLSFFGYIRNKMNSKHLLLIWSTILILALLANFLLPSFPE